MSAAAMSGAAVAGKSVSLVKEIVFASALGLACGSVWKARAGDTRGSAPLRLVLRRRRRRLERCVRTREERGDR